MGEREQRREIRSTLEESAPSAVSILVRCDDGEAFRARIIDISASGMGLVMLEPDLSRMPRHGGEMAVKVEKPAYELRGMCVHCGKRNSGARFGFYVHNPVELHKLHRLREAILAEKTVKDDY
jgi:hypothetical protein